MWFTILHDLAEFFRNDVDLQGCLVIEGSGVTIEDYPAIEVMRDAEPETNFHGKRGKVKFNVQPWIRNDDPDPVRGYEDIFALERKIVAAIAKWQKVPKDGYAIMVELKNTLGDGDVFRPVCGSRIPIHIEWRTVKM